MKDNTKTTVLMKIQEARKKIKDMKIKKEGYNEYSKYEYFTPEQTGSITWKVCLELKLFTKFDLKRNEFGEYGALTVFDLETGDSETFEMSTDTPEITATNATQRAGGMATYTERYLKQSVFDIQDNNLDPDSQDHRDSQKSNPKVSKIKIDKEEAQMITDMTKLYPDDNFIKSLGEGLKKYGKLTDKQHAALQNKVDMAKDADPRYKEMIDEELDNEVNPDDIPF